jgi:hypothetical protein
MRNKNTRKIVHQKLIDYFFNPENKKGWAKGQWFIRALGFDPSQPKHIALLEKQIAYNNNIALFSHHSPWGPRFIQKLTVTGPNGKIIDGIRAVWQRDRNARTIRLVTMYPPK